MSEITLSLEHPSLGCGEIIARYDLSEIQKKAYEQGRADAIDECKYNVELFREIFLEELERQAVDSEEIFMYRNICSMAWNKYLEQLKKQNQTI